MTFTAGELSAAILAIVGLVLTILNIVDKTATLKARATEPEKEQNKRLDDIEDSIRRIKERLDDGNKRFEADAAKIRALEENMRTSNKVIIESLQALTVHALDNSHVDELKEAKKTLDSYLLSR